MFLRKINKEIFISILLIVIDQLIKFSINSNLLLNQNIHIFKFFDITKLYNYGISFSFLNGHNILIIIISIGAIFYLWKIKKEFQTNKIFSLGLMLIITGGIGNLIDRIIHGYVIDYFKVTLFNINFPIFNFADTLVTLGFLVLIIGIIRKEDYGNNS